MEHFFHAQGYREMSIISIGWVRTTSEKGSQISELAAHSRASSKIDFFIQIDKSQGDINLGPEPEQHNQRQDA